MQNAGGASDVGSSAETQPGVERHRDQDGPLQAAGGVRLKEVSEVGYRRPEMREGKYFLRALSAVVTLRLPR